jgi:hypothetical protein
MSTPANPSSPKPRGDDRNLVTAGENAVPLTFEDKLHRFWEQNQTTVFVVVAAIVLGFAGKGLWDYLARQRELDVEKAYAAATTTEQLKSFAASHDNHPLAGIAQLRVADEAYTAGKYADALAGYEKALPALSGSPLAGRAQLGRAMAKVQSGKAAEGTNELKQLAGDTNQFNAIRAEAAYQVASLAAEAGNATDVQKFTDQLLQIDPSSPWAQRGMMLRATLPAPVAAPAPSPASAAAPAAPSTKEAAPSSSTPIKLPGK